MKNKLIVALAFGLFVSNSALSQNYSNLIIFGDSSSDSGYYKYTNIFFPTNRLGKATYGAFTTNPDPMWNVSLGQRFGVTVTPSNAPERGNNYAAGGARVSYQPANVSWLSASNQAQSYLASTGGVADSRALYAVWIGLNDLSTTTSGGLGNILNPQNVAGINTLASQTAAIVGSLYAAGARNFLIPNLYGPSSQAAADARGRVWDPIASSSSNIYSQAVWNSVAAQGINFIPADVKTVYNYMLLNPSQFGFTNTNQNTAACTAGIGAFNCGPANYVTPNANQTYMFADSPNSQGSSGGHLAGAAQKVEADYFYGLITAPGQVSMIANQAALTQIANNNSYMDQVGYSFRGSAPKTLGAWILGGANQLNISGSPASSSSTPYNGAAGMDYQYNESLVLGGFVGYGQAQVNYNTSGNFTQSGTTLGAYSGYKFGGVWINGLANYNWLNNNVNRVTPIGITSFTNTSSVNGSNASVALQTGYSFNYDMVGHGPVLGYVYVKTAINGFTESGNFNSLQFGSQTINSSVGSIGYQAQAKLGNWLPFARATYNGQFGNNDRSISTTLTTITAPSYSMSAISYGKNWTNLTAGLGYQIDTKTVLRASYTQQVSQESVSSYNAVISLTSHF